MIRNWDAHFMAKAQLNAAMSTCHARHVGAVAVIERRQLADGFNGNLPGATHCDEGGCERCKNRAFSHGEDIMRCVCVHAEQNIVAWCARSRVCLEGATVYSTTHPCADCLKLLLMSGVVAIVYRDSYAEGERMAILLGADDKLRRWTA